MTPPPDRSSAPPAELGSLTRVDIHLLEMRRLVVLAFRELREAKVALAEARHEVEELAESLRSSQEGD